MRSRILRFVVRNLLNAVSIDDLLRVENGKVFLGKRELAKEEIDTLRKEASVFEKTLLWKLMLNNLFWIANFKMIRGASSEFEMTNGRMMTLCIDTLEQFLERLRTLK